MRDFAVVLPVALELDLQNAGWDGQLKPYPGITHRQYAFQAQARSLLKKFEDQPSEEADARALNLFMKMNEHCAQFQNPEPKCTEVEWECLGEAREFLREFFAPATARWSDRDSPDPINMYDIGQAFSLGNGSNLGSPGTDFLSKVGLSNLATTSLDLYRLFGQAITGSRVWSDVESIRLLNRGVAVVPGSRIAFVPKNTEISRTVCTEPVLNMLFQKGVGACITRRLHRVCNIDLRIQPEFNRALCRIGSESGEFGTIDLSSASDTISNKLVEWLIPRSARSWLNMCRSPSTTLPNGDLLGLHMVSSMGNAYTFPLQTVIFYSLVQAAYKVLGITPEHGVAVGKRIVRTGNIAVFGDDIVVIREAYRLTARLLSHCGFIVNLDKSFNEGPFRESCGHDYFDGHDVRGVYIRSLRTSGDKYSAINRLNVWSAKHGVPLPYTISFLLSGLRKLYVPFEESDDAGIKVPSSMVTHYKSGRGKFRYYGKQFRYLAPRVAEVSVTDVESQPPALKGWFYNPDAVLLAAIAGTLRKGKVVPRSTRPSSLVKVAYSSCWDYMPPDRHVNADFVARWKTFCEGNLTFFGSQLG